MMRNIFVFIGFLLICSCGKNENEEFLSQLFLENDSVMNTYTLADTIDNGLLALYHFDYDVLDASGHNRHGEEIGDLYVVYDHHGNPEKALGILNKNDGYVRIPFYDIFVSNTFSINAWVKNTGNKNYYATIMQMGREDEAGSFWMNYHHLSIVNSKGIREQVPFIHPDTVPTFNYWNMLTATVSGRQVKMYVNGELDYSAELSAPFKPLSKQQYATLIGYSEYESDNGYSFEGSLDEVRIYDRMLKAEEVKYLYNQ